MSKAQNKNTLGLGGDGDDGQFVEDIEEIFAVRVTDAEAAPLHTVGDLFVLLSKKLNAVHDRRPVCFSAHAFYRIRRALTDDIVDRSIQPATDLGVLVGERDARRWRKELENITGLHVPVRLKTNLR